MAGFFIPAQSDTPELRQNYFEVTDATTAQILAATLGQTLYENPLASAMRSIDYLANRGQGRKLSAQEWEESEFFREGLSIPDGGINEGAASILADRHDQRAVRNLVLQRSPGGLGLASGQLAVGLLGTALDPLNVAASFIPVVGQARFAAQIAKHGKGVARARKGLAEGAVGAAAVEPIVLSTAMLEQNEDYTYATAFMNIAFGSALGGGLHVVGGRFSDALEKANPKTVRALQENAVSKTVQGQEIEQNLTVRQDPQMRNNPIFRDVTEVRQGQADLPVMPPKKGKAYPDALRIAYREEARPQSITKFIRSIGGILRNDPNAADVRKAMGGKDSLLKKSPKRKGQPLPPEQKPLDKVREAAEEAGYLREDSDINDLLAAIESDADGNFVYPIAEADFPARLEQQLAIKDELDKYGIDPRGYTDEQVEQILEYYTQVDQVPEDIPGELTEDDFFAARQREQENLGKSLDVKDFEARMREADEGAKAFDKDMLAKLQEENERLEDDIRYFIESEQLSAEVQAEIEAYNRLEQKADQGYSVALRAAQNCVPGEL